MFKAITSPADRAAIAEALTKSYKGWPPTARVVAARAFLVGIITLNQAPTRCRFSHLACERLLRSLLNLPRVQPSACAGPAAAILRSKRGKP